MIMQPQTAESVYAQVIKPLPPAERLRLATLILNDIPSQAMVDYSGAWTDEDYHDFTAASWAYILNRLPVT